MPITLVDRSTHSYNSVSSTLVSLGARPQRYNMLVAWVGIRDNVRSVTGITQTGASWQRVAETGEVKNRLECWIAKNLPTHPSSQATVHFDGVTSGAAIVEELQGADLDSPYLASADDCRTWGRVRNYQNYSDNVTNLPPIPLTFTPLNDSRLIVLYTSNGGDDFMTNITQTNALWTQKRVVQ
jgi:hypothetical protein